MPEVVKDVKGNRCERMTTKDMKFKIYFATSNDHKVAEVQAIVKEFGIIVEKLNLDKEEDKEKSIENVAVINAEKFSRKYKLPVVVEDTGFFFNEYDNFPGSNPKMVFSQIGYKGLLKLLENEHNRAAEFRSAVAFSNGNETKLFTGRLSGFITTKPEGENLDVMPYERIFVVDGQEKPICFLSREEKNKISHRSQAFKELAKWLAASRGLSPKKEIVASVPDDSGLPDNESWKTNNDIY